MNPDQNIHQLIVRLFAGEGSDEEKSTIESWLNQDTENQKLLDELKEIWLSTGLEHNPDRYDVEEAIRQFQEKTGFFTKKISRRKLHYQLLRYAAILALAAALPASYYFGKKSVSSSDSVTTITCPLGDKTSIILPDSSLVCLNSGSRITFNNNFQNGSRQVYLDGEAFFTVHKNPKNPFQVKTTDLVVEVLGTEFNLKAYPNEKTITTTLVKGCLKVYANHNAIKIKPNQKLIYNKRNQEIKLKEVCDLSPEIEWKNGRLVFHNQSLEELREKLERWFDVEIKFGDEQVKARRFTGTLEHESILEAISYFGRSKYVAYKIKDNVITFFTKLQTDMPMN